MRDRAWVILALVVASPAFLCGDLVTIDFETFPDGTQILDSTPITTQIPGVTLTNTTVITAGIGLNELEFPPHSGSNVAFDDGGPIGITFGSPVRGFSGFFTYVEPLTITAFNESGVAVASATSAFSSNIACGGGPPCSGDPGSSPDELIQVDSSIGFSSITITADPNGSSLVMDDVSYISNTPEPSYILTVVIIGMMLIRRRVTTARSRAASSTP